MALIKKYNTGGSFKDYVNERLLKGDLPLTTKSYSYMQDALQTFDPNTVSSDQPVGELKKTWAGQFNLDSTNTNAYLANLYKEYQQAAPKEIPITPIGSEEMLLAKLKMARLPAPRRDAKAVIKSVVH